MRPATAPPEHPEFGTLDEEKNLDTSQSLDTPDDPWPTQVLFDCYNE